MFTNLIESQSHKKDFKRRGSFVLMTLAGYALFFVFAGVLSIYAYDAHLESQDQELVLLEFVPPVTPPPNTVRTPDPRPRSGGDSGGPARPQKLPELYDAPSDPRKTPDQISSAAQPIPPARGNAERDTSVFDPGSSGRGTDPIGGNPNGKGGGTEVPDIGEPPPAKVPVSPPRPPTVQRKVINGLAVSLPTPPYPILAKQIGMQGVVSVQVLLDESGKVVSAKAVSGHPTLTRAAVDAAYRARFSPTFIGNQPVKVSGIITYNFTLH